MSDNQITHREDQIVESLRAELAKTEPSHKKRVIEKFVLAALGSIPWIGGFLSAAASYKAEEGALKQDSLQTQWLAEHNDKIIQLKSTLENVQGRFDSLGEVVDERIQSEEYIGLVRKAF